MKLHEQTITVPNIDNPCKAVPFLKWAGGKRWFISQHNNLLPSHYNRYIEPFLGSGAVFFHLRPNSAIIADSNQDLIETYIAIRDFPEEIQNLLQIHQRYHSKEYYYTIRQSNYETIWEKAARFLYLNRTCWNGLYRVNRQGQFNVPIGTKTKVMLDTDNFPFISEILAKTKILTSDFESVIDQAEEEDFIFIDPPYTVKHNENGFVNYNEKIFSWEDQIRLRDSIGRAATRGARILMTNADHESIRQLYNGMCQIESVERSSIIAGKSTHRGKTTEVLIQIGEGW